MKYLNIYVLFILLLLSISGCKKDDSNPVNENNFTGQGADYQPLIEGRSFTGKISGTYAEYDSLGNVMDYSQMTNQIYTGNFGVFLTARGMNVLPIYVNENGSNELICYLNSNNGSITGFGKNSINPVGLLLPTDLSIGREWIINPASPTKNQFKVKLVEALNSYTNSAGNTFQNTLNLHFTAADSSREGNYYYYYYSTQKVDANVYFAKGIGIVGVKVNNYEEILSYHSTYYTDYRRKVIQGGVVAISY